MQNLFEPGPKFEQKKSRNIENMFVAELFEFFLLLSQ